MSATAKKRFLWTWSATKLSTFLRCPAQFFFTYIDPLPYREPIDRLFGKEIHAMLERFFKKKYRSKRTFLNSWGFFWRRSVLSREGLIQWRRADQDAEAEMLEMTGRAILSRFWDENIVLRGTPLEPEVEMPFRIPFGPFTLVGVIDRIQPVAGGLYEIGDYKTGMRRYGSPEMARDLQFSFYQLAYERKRGASPRAMYISQLTSRETRRIDVPVRTQEDYLVLFELLSLATTRLLRLLTTAPNPRDEPITSRMMDNFPQRIFHPLSGSHCNWCEFEKICFERRGKSVEDLRRQLGTEALAERVVDTNTYQLSFNLTFVSRKSQPYLHKKDTIVEKHKRRARRGGQLSWEF